MVKWTVLILLLLLAFGKQIMAFLGIGCSCENPGETDLGGEINLPDQEISAKQTTVDVELYQRAEDQDVQFLSDQELVKQFFPGTQTLELTTLSYDKINL